MKKIVCFFFTLLLIVACNKEDESQPVTPQRTVIAYLCGDNNLSSEIENKLNALWEGMKKTGKTDNNLVVYADSRDAMPKLWKVTNTGIDLLKEYTEINSASSENLNQILTGIMSDFPAKSYGLICFSHASGWLPKGALNNPTDFMGSNNTHKRTIFDDGGYEMPIDEFAEAIPLTENGDKFEFIIFETCYMAGIEVAWELRNKAKYLVGSSAEILSPGMVDIYPNHLVDLFQETPNLTQFAQAYFNHWNEKKGAARSATISVINLAHMQPLADIIKDIYRNGDTISDIKNIQHFNRNAGALFFDLSDYMQSIADTAQYTTYEEALKQVVEYKNNTPQFMIGYPYCFNIEKHSGLTTYIMQESYPDLNNKYQQSSWVQEVN